MALLEKLNHLRNVTRQSPHKPIQGDYFVFEGNGLKYLQINTYGSDGRQIPGKTSQTIQFSEESIKQLKEIIEMHF